MLDGETLRIRTVIGIFSSRKLDNRAFLKCVMTARSFKEYVQHDCQLFLDMLAKKSLFSLNLSFLCVDKAAQQLVWSFLDCDKSPLEQKLSVCQ